MDSEERTRAKLVEEWTSFPAADKVRCIRTAIPFEPTYTELAACLEMARDARAYKAGEPVFTPKAKR